MPAIHQLVAGFSKGDAISNEARTLRDLFRAWGHDAEIFCPPDCFHPGLRSEATTVGALPDRVAPDDVVLLHFSMGSDINDLFARLNCRKVLLYHNITPDHFFRVLQPHTADLLQRGREQVQQLAGVADVNLAVSRYNASELEAAGYANVQVLPIVLDFDHLSAEPDPCVMDGYDDSLTNILFVGRCAPNKAIGDLVRLFACYQKHVNPTSRLIHVGSFTGMEAYCGTVRILARNLGLRDVHFMGSVSHAELIAFYQLADLFLCASEHEGFCIPVLESMVFDVPILAYAAGAVPETLDGAGVVFQEKHPEKVAEMMNRMIQDQPFRAAILQGQQQRLTRYRELNLEATLHRLLAPVL